MMMMIAVEPNYPAAKRQKRSLSPPPLFDDETSSLGGIEDHYDYEEDEEEEGDLEREETLLDRVLSIYEQYEEDSLVQQSRLRSKLSTCGISKICMIKNRLQDEKVKCGLFKVLTLLLQSDSRLRGSSYQERVDLMRQVKHVLQARESYTLAELKSRFVLIFSSLRKDLFPPCSIIAPASTATLPQDIETQLDHKSLVQETRKTMTRLDQAANEALQQRLRDSNYSQVEGEEWESMREVWYVWLQFSIKSIEQMAVWQETLAHCENVEMLLWNLAFCLSMMPEEYF